MSGTLLLDLGNTRIKWALATSAGPGRACAAAHEGCGLSAAARAGILALGRPEAVVAASVAHAALNDALVEFASTHWNLGVRFLATERRRRGVVCGYHNPAYLGVDRWAALVAARALIAGPVGVVDAGTAVTLDFLDAAGRHLGGVIFPGPRLMRQSLFTGTDHLDLVGDGAPRVFARDTGDGIFAGTLLGVAGAIDSIRRTMQDDSGLRADWLLTGGAAGEVLPHLRSVYHHRPDLVLDGVFRLAKVDCLS